MGVTKKFLVDSSNFAEIAEALRTAESLPELIDAECLELLGYTNPPDFLVLSLFKELNLINQDDTPTSLFEKFRNPETSKKAIAYGVASAYEELLEADSKVYEKSEDEIIESLRSLFEEDKSDLILKYMANTFKVVADYAGHDTLAEVLEKDSSGTSNIETIVKEIAGKYNQENAKANRNGIETEEQIAVQEEQSEVEKAANKASDGTKFTEDLSQEIEEANQDFEELSESEDFPTGGDDLDHNTVAGEGDGSVESEHEVNNADQSSKTVRKDTDTNSDYINQAYIKKAELLYKLDRYEEALPALDDVYQNFADSDKDTFYNHASVALVRKMKVAETLGKTDELIPIYNDVIERLDLSEENEFTTHVDHAYLNRVDILLEQNRSDEEALEAIDEAIDRFKHIPEKQNFVIQSMYKKAELLEQSGFDQKALEAYEQLLDSFG